MRLLLTSVLFVLLLVSALSSCSSNTSSKTDQYDWEAYTALHELRRRIRTQGQEYLAAEKTVGLNTSVEDQLWLSQSIAWLEELQPSFLEMERGVLRGTRTLQDVKTYRAAIEKQMDILVHSKQWQHFREALEKLCRSPSGC